MRRTGHAAIGVLALVGIAWPTAHLACAADPVSTRPTTRLAGMTPRGSLAGTRPAGDRAPVMGHGPTCAFAATIYEIRLPPDRIGLIDADRL